MASSISKVIQNVMVNALIHHACGVNADCTRTHMLMWEKRQHKGSPQCAQMGRKEPDCVIVTVLAAHDASHTQSFC